MKPVISVILALSLATLACNINLNLPVTQVKTGPSTTDEISVPIPGDPDTVTAVTLAFGAGKLHLQSGAEGALASGTATYNVPEFKPVVRSAGDQVSIEQGNLELRGIPQFDQRVQNEWDLRFGKSPLRLRINAGAYNGVYELGGLSLQELEINDGASDVELSFAEPNLAEMGTFEYKTGASSIKMENLANANFNMLIFQGGAGNYRLDFGGELKRDTDVRIETGFSTLEIVVPQGVSARLTFDGGLGDVDLGGSWEKSGDEYNHPGSGPQIRVDVKIGAGNLKLNDR